MSNHLSVRFSAGVRLDINRDSAFLNQFVGTNFEETGDVIEGDQKDPLKLFAPQKADIFVKSAIGRKQKNGEQVVKKVEFEKAVKLLVPEEDPGEELKKDRPEGEENDEPKVVVAEASGKEEKIKPKIGQKQLNQELKKKRKKRRRPKPEEVYTDKDRAAAVNLGSRDIKQSLRIKRKEDRTRIFQMPEEAEPGAYLALGSSELIRRGPFSALPFYNKALELNPMEKQSLVARSKCFILLGQPEKGLEDAEQALAIDKKFVKGIYQKAEALYYLGNFEHSLMYYHRGLKIRPEFEGFQLGVHKAQKAIENAVGGAFPNLKLKSANCSRTETPMMTTKTTPTTADSKSTAAETKSTANTTDSNTSNSKFTTRGNLKSSTADLTRKSTSTVRVKTAKKGSRLLRELKDDKEYLDKLLNHPDIKCKNKEDNSQVIGYIQEAVDFLNKRQEFWRQQLPSNYK